MLWRRGINTTPPAESSTVQEYAHWIMKETLVPPRARYVRPSFYKVCVFSCFQSRHRCGLGQVLACHSLPFMCRKQHMTEHRPSAQAAEKLLYPFTAHMGGQREKSWVHLCGIMTLSDVLWCGLYFISWTLSRACRYMLCIPREGETMLHWSGVQLTLDNWVTGPILNALYDSEVQSGVMCW